MSDSFERSLQTHLHRIECPDPITLGEYQLGLLGRADKLEVRDHLGTCAHCRREIGVLVRYMYDTADRPAEAAFDSFWRRAEQFLVNLVSDLNPVPAPVRDSDGQLETQTEFGIRRAGPFVVNLTIQPHPEQSGAKTMVGHISHIDHPDYAFADWDVQFWQNDHLMQVSSFDRYNSFLLHAQSPEPFEIVLSGDEDQIRLRHKAEIG